MRKTLLRFVPGLVAACGGGVVGHFAAYWISQQGFFAPVIPGAFAGLACGFCSVDHSRARGLLCGAIALVAGLASYWKLFTPAFETDGSFLDLVLHAHRLQPLTQMMILLGTFLGFWWGRETTSPWRGRFARSPTETRAGPAGRSTTIERPAGGDGAGRGRSRGRGRARSSGPILRPGAAVCLP